MSWEDLVLDQNYRAMISNLISMLVIISHALSFHIMTGLSIVKIYTVIATQKFSCAFTSEHWVMFRVPHHKWTQVPFSEVGLLLQEIIFSPYFRRKALFFLEVHPVKGVCICGMQQILSAACWAAKDIARKNASNDWGHGCPFIDGFNIPQLGFMKCFLVK